MDFGGIAALLTAIVAAVAALYRWSVAQGKKEALAEQVQKTLAAKDAEIAELKADKEQLEAWVDAWTRPSGRQP